MKIKELDDRLVPVLIENLRPNRQGHILLCPQGLQLLKKRTPIILWQL